MYKILICPQCMNPMIYEVPEGEPQESIQCGSCGKQHKIEKLRVYHTEEDHDKAVLLRSREIARLDDSMTVEEWETLLESGQLTEEPADGSNMYEYLSNIDGIDPAKYTEEDDRPDIEVFKDAFNTLNRPTEEEVIEYCTTYGVDEEKAEHMINKALQQGLLSQQEGRLKNLV